MEFLTLRDIKKSYRDRLILPGVGFELARGRAMAMAGANGAGKTTLLRILSLTAKPDSGEYFFGGVDALRHPQAVRPKVSYVPQQNSALLELTVSDNLKYWARAGSDIGAAVEGLGLGKYLHMRASSLSGGYLRRLNLAIAQINSPELLIMDEPLTGVDIDTRLHFMSWVRALRGAGVTIVYTTHHTDEIEGIADCMSIVYSGGLKFIDNIEGLYLDNLISRFINL